MNNGGDQCLVPSGDPGVFFRSTVCVYVCVCVCGWGWWWEEWKEAQWEQLLLSQHTLHTKPSAMLTPENTHTHTHQTFLLSSLNTNYTYKEKYTLLFYYCRSDSFYYDFFYYYYFTNSLLLAQCMHSVDDKERFPSYPPVREKYWLNFEHVN